MTHGCPTAACVACDDRTRAAGDTPAYIACSSPSNDTPFSVQTGEATAETYGGLFTDAPELFDVILMNPPFGGKEGKEAQTRFAYKTRATQVLFLQHVIDALEIKDGQTGFLVNNVNEAARALQRLAEIDRSACRQRVQQCFSVETMVEAYERVYSTIFDLEAKRPS